MKQQLQWMGDDGNVSGTAKSSSLLCCFCQVDFERFLHFTERHLHIQSERWRSSMETEDTMMHAGEAEKSSPVNFRGFVFCSVWNVKVCLDWKQRHLDLISSASETHLIFKQNHLVSHTNSFCVVIDHSLEEKLNHWDLLPFLLPCFPVRFCSYPANRTADPASTLAACHSTDSFCFN